MPPVKAFHPVKTVTFRGQTVKVVADRPVTTAQGERLARQLVDAFQYDKAQLQAGTGPGPAITLRITDRLKEGAGVALNAGTFEISSSLLKQGDPNTLAHELSHLWDMRHAGPNIAGVPYYLQEGRACALGDGYDLARGVDDTWLRDEANACAGLTADFVQRVFDHPTGPVTETFRGEITGEAYVEFLKQHFASDAIARLGHMTVAMAGGKPYDSAFRAQFGVLPKAAERQFVDFIRRTESNRTARLKGTVFEGH
jgi:hypothetical protein